MSKINTHVLVGLCSKSDPSARLSIYLNGSLAGEALELLLEVLEVCAHHVLLALLAVAEELHRRHRLDVLRLRHLRLLVDIHLTIITHSLTRGVS